MVAAIRSAYGAVADEDRRRRANRKCETRFAFAAIHKRAERHHETRPHRRLWRLARALMGRNKNARWIAAPRQGGDQKVRSLAGAREWNYPLREDEEAPPAGGCRAIKIKSYQIRIRSYRLDPPGRRVGYFIVIKGLKSAGAPPSAPPMVTR